VPIALLAKRMLARFDLRDEAGAAVALATSEQNAAFATEHMLSIASEVLGGEPSPRLRTLCWVIARGHPGQAAAAMNEIQQDPEGEWTGLVKDERFRAASLAFASHFALLVEVGGEPRRRVLKFAYDQEPGVDLTWRERLGLVPALLKIAIADLGDAASRHLEVVRAQGLDILAVQLVEPSPGRNRVIREESGEDGDVHLAVTRAPRGTRGRAEIFLRAARAGILAGGPLLAALSAAALTAAWFALPDSAGDGGGAASILLAVPAALGAYLGARHPHPLEAAMLFGARGLVFAAGALAFVGAVSLALVGSVELLRVVLGVAALGSWLATAGLLVTWLLPLRPDRESEGDLL
jgi:hypothetical protein